MTLVRLHPLRGFDTFERSLSRLIDEAFSPTWNDFTEINHVPAAEISQTDTAVTLKIEIPGIEAKDLDIQVTENVASVSGERRSEDKTETDGAIRSEFHYGKFRRVIPLPARVDNTSVEADYQNGILNLTLPKTEAEKNKVVKVNLEAAAA